LRSGAPEVVTRSALRLANEEDAEEFCSRRHALASLYRSVDYFNCSRCIEIVVETYPDRIKSCLTIDSTRGSCGSQPEFKTSC
jgi:hypothetical protein